MANPFTVSPFGLRFDSAPVQGSVAALDIIAPQALAFLFYNNSGASVTVTNYGFSTSTDGDAVTQPNGIYTNSDFVVVPTGGAFPVTVANGANQSFTVTYAPLRRGSGFGDIRSAILTLYSGSKAITNGGQTTNSSGEVINLGVPTPVTVGVGGGVTEEGYDWPSTHPIYWSAGSNASMSTPGTGEVSNSGGISPNASLAAMDTTRHYGPMLFWAEGSEPTANAASTPGRAAAPGAAPYWNGTAYVPAVNYDYGSPRGGRSYQILIFWGKDTQTFNLSIAVKLSAGNSVVANWTGLTPANSSGLFIGNVEGLDLQGLQLVATTTSGTYSSATYNIGAVITG